MPALYAEQKNFLSKILAKNKAVMPYSFACDRIDMRFIELLRKILAKKD